MVASRTKTGAPRRFIRVRLDGSPGQVSTGCLWIIGETDAVGWHYCQHPRARGSDAWCEAHLVRLTARVPPRAPPPEPYKPRPPAKSQDAPKRWHKNRAS
jgi:hypothetical protein